MTTDRDFDRIAAAWLDLMPDRAPDRVVAEILEDVALTPQARRPLVRLPGASPRVDRLMLIAATILLGAAILGGAVLLAGGQPPTPLPTPAAPPSAVPSPTAAASADPSPTVAASVVNASLVGTWISTKPDDLFFGTTAAGGRLSLVIPSSGSLSWVLAPDGPAEHLLATVDAPAADRLRFTARGAAEPVTVAGASVPGCTADDAGTYTAQRSPDGLTLNLEPLDDPCPARSAVLARTWTRSVGEATSGGLQVVDAFDPLVTVQLPAGSYSVDRAPGAITVVQPVPELQFLAFQDPQGFNDPCDPVGGGRRAIAPGADAIVAYFRQLPGFTVDSVTEQRVDGHRAVRLVVHANADASCPDGRLAEWQPKAVTDDLHWFLRPGDIDSLVIVELPDSTVMLEVLPAPHALEDQVIGSIRFIDRLPSTP